MVFKIDDNRYSFHANDINESRYVLGEINKNILNVKETNRYIENLSNSELIRKINEVISKEGIAKYVKECSANYKEMYIKFQSVYLSWINDDLNSGLYLWFSLFVYDFEDDRRRAVKEEAELLEKLRPASLNNITMDVMHYVSSKINRMEFIGGRINDIHKKYQELTGVKRLGWLKDDEEQINWAYQYLKEKDGRFRRLYTGDRINALEFIKVYYDLHIDDREMKFTFVEMSNAWNQQKYRAKRKQDDKKALSGYISVEAKSKLKEIARKEKLSESEMIELLIMTY